MTEFKIEDQIDALFKGKPETLKKVKENREFKTFIKENKVSPEYENTMVFGVKSVNYNAILKDNIQDHSVFTIDKLCRMFRNMTYEQLKKYQHKKRSVPFNMIWLLIIMFGVVVAVLVVWFLFSSSGAVI